MTSSTTTTHGSHGMPSLARSGPVSSTIETQNTCRRGAHHLLTATHISLHRSYLRSPSSRTQYVYVHPYTKHMLTLCRPNNIIASSEAPVLQKPKPERKQSFDPAATAQLEKSLAHRPDKNALIERNILKGRSSTTGMIWYLGLRGRRADDSVAPALQAAKEKLQRSQLEVSVLAERESVGNRETYARIGQTRACSPSPTKARRAREGRHP